MLRRIFPGGRNSPDNSNSNQAGGEDDPSEQPPAHEIPSTPLVRTTEGKTVVRLYLEVLGCDHLGPDYDDNGNRIDEDSITYNPYVKVKLGGKDDKNSLDIHKTKPVQQR